MNSRTRTWHVAVAFFFAGVALLTANTATAGWFFPRFDIGDFSQHVRSLREAEKLPAGTKIAMACRECKMLDVHDVSQKDSMLAWFSPQVQHKCPGCGGKMTYKGTAASTGGTQYTHVCTRCGNNSTYICAKTPKAKPRS